MAGAQSECLIEVLHCGQASMHADNRLHVEPLPDDYAMKFRACFEYRERWHAFRPIKKVTLEDRARFRGECHEHRFGMYAVDRVEA